MANPIRLFAEFKDDLGNDYRLNIHQAGWVVTPHEFNLGADGFTLRYTGDNENRMQGIIGSEVTFTLMENTSSQTAFLVALATSQDADFQISIYKDPDNTNVLFWTGVLLSEQIELQDEAYPIVNTLTAADELGNLKNIIYNNDGNPYTGRVNLVEHLHNCIAKTRALHIYDSTDFIIQYANNFFPTSISSTNALNESYVNHSAFYNVDEDGVIQYLDTFTILENIATTFNARIFYANGIFNFVPIGAVADNLTLTLHKITKSGLLSGSTFTSDTEKVNGTDFIKLAGNASAFLQPLQLVRRTWEINANFPVAYDQQRLYPVGAQTAMGTEITDSDLSYSQGSTINLVVNYVHTCQPASPPIVGGLIGRIVLKIQIKIGSQYYVNDISFVPLEFVYGTWYDIDAAHSMEITDAQWSSTPGYFYLPVTVGESYVDTSTGIYSNGNMLWNANVVPISPIPNIPLTIPLILPSDETGLTCSVNVRAYGSYGGPSPGLISQGNQGALNIGFYAMTGNDTNGDQIVYQANTGNHGRGEFEQPNVFFGSSALNTDKNIFESSAGGDEPLFDWSSLANPSADTGIHSLGVREVLAGQNDSTPIKRGGYFKTFLSPFNSLSFAGSTYLPFETSFIARSVEGDFEAFEIVEHDDGIVAPEPEIIDTNEPQDDNGPVIDLRNIVAQETQGISPNILRRMIQQPVTSIVNRNAAVYNVRSIDYMMFNTWTGANGSSLIYLPTVTGNEGRTMQFHSDSTLAANKYAELRPFATDTGVTIDGAASYDFDRAYDGITILCHGGQWYIIQKKEK